MTLKKGRSATMTRGCKRHARPRQRSGGTATLFGALNVLDGTRHGISRLPEVEGSKPQKKKFKSYPIGFFHLDIAEVRTGERKLYVNAGANPGHCASAIAGHIRQRLV